jgi:hypothetical protein
MRKFIIATVAAASLLTAVSAANACVWVTPYFCQTVCGYNIYGVWVCG